MKNEKGRSFRKANCVKDKERKRKKEERIEKVRTRLKKKWKWKEIGCRKIEESNEKEKVGIKLRKEGVSEK